MGALDFSTLCWKVSTGFIRKCATQVLSLIYTPNAAALFQAFATCLIYLSEPLLIQQVSRHSSLLVVLCIPSANTYKILPVRIGIDTCLYATFLVLSAWPAGPSVSTFRPGCQLHLAMNLLCLVSPLVVNIRFQALHAYVKQTNIYVYMCEQELQLWNALTLYLIESDRTLSHQSPF